MEEWAHMIAMEDYGKGRDRAENPLASSFGTQPTSTAELVSQITGKQIPTVDQLRRSGGGGWVPPNRTQAERRGREIMGQD